MSMSRTALDVKIERYEIQTLLEWHRDEQFRCADKQEYADAEDHKRRAAELFEILKTPLEATEKT